MTAKEIEDCLLAEENEKQRNHLMRFFKTGNGDYGEGDMFIGLTVPQTRLVVKEARGRVSPEEIEKLLYSKWHEVRLAGFLLLAEEMNLAIPKKKGKGSTDKREKKRGDSEILSTPCSPGKQLGSR